MTTLNEAMAVLVAEGYKYESGSGTIDIRASVAGNDKDERAVRNGAQNANLTTQNWHLGPEGLGMYSRRFSSDPETSYEYLARAWGDSQIQDFIVRNGNVITFKTLKKEAGKSDSAIVYAGTRGVVKVKKINYNETGRFGTIFKYAVLASIVAATGYGIAAAAGGGAAAGAVAESAAVSPIGGTGLSLGATSSGAGITAGVSSGAGLVIPTAQTGIIGAGIGASLPALGASAIALSPAATGASSALGGASTIGKIGSAVSTVKSTIGAAGSVVATGKQLAAIGGAVGALTGKGGSGTQQAPNPPPSSITLDPVTITGKRLPDYSWALIAALAVSAKFL